MKTVYVITSGSYSDYRLDLIFETRELAEAFCEREKAVDSYRDPYEVEEYGLWDELPSPATIVYRAAAEVRIPDQQVANSQEWSNRVDSWGDSEWAALGLAEGTSNNGRIRWCRVSASTPQEAARARDEWVAGQMQTRP